MRLILASGSKRRLDLLNQIGVTPDEIAPTDVDETPLQGETPLACALRLATEKADSAVATPADLVLAADTIVALGRRMLGKPEGADAARRFLSLLSGRRHRVITAIAIRRNDRVWSRAVKTVVRFKQISEQELNAYLETGEWQGKAGGYAIQGAAATLIPWISGSYSGVVGLPLSETATLLDAAGYGR